jgi:hypothetical protein
MFRNSDIAKATKQSRRVCQILDCFAEFIIGPAKGRTCWLAMTLSREAGPPPNLSL